MADLVNPLVPAGFDVLWSTIVVLLFALMVAAIVSIARHARRMQWRVYALWLLAVLALPVVGSLLWFAIGMRGARARS